MLRAGVGFSRDFDARRAGRRAAEEAMVSAHAPTVAIVYGTVLYDANELLAGIREVIGEGVPLVGASTQGISRAGEVHEVPRAVGVALLSIPGGESRTACVRGVGRDARAAGKQIAEAIGPGEGKCPLFVWYDPLTGADTQALIDGLAEGGHARVLGGAAGQPWGPLFRTFQYLGGEAMSDAVVALKLDGPIEALIELSHGTEPLGFEFEVTRASGNRLQEIDGRSALAVWLDTLGGGAVPDTVPWAIGVRPKGDLPFEGLVARAVYGIDEPKGELILAASIQEGSRIHLCHRTRQAVFDGAIGMAHRLRARLAQREPLIAMSFECAARPRPFLGDTLAQQEVCEIQGILGDEIPWIGCYAWGEIAPIGASSWFHNYTFPLVVLTAAER